MPLTKYLTILFLVCGNLAIAQNDLATLLEKYNSHSIPYISVQELKMLQKENSVIILDAREKEEFEVSRIKNAVYIGYSDFSAEEVSQLFSNKNVPVVVYCSLGIRSENISEKLKKEGFKNVRNLYGGIFEWKNNGFPVFNSEEKETEKVHTYSRSWSRWLKRGEKIY